MPSDLRVTKDFLADFDTVIEWMIKHYPNAWPSEERTALVEEAKAGVRRNPEQAMPWFRAQAQSIRATGEME